MIFEKNYRDIEFADLERLVDNKIAENRTLDYKKTIKLDKGDQRKEFLYDISSFANTDGGVIIYGISEQKDENGNNTGLPEELCGIDIDNFDKLILKIEDLLKTSIEPNISGVIIKPLQKESIKVLFIGITKSLGLPRMVTYNATNKFYRRRNSGKYLVDIYELNQMFMENIELYKELNNNRIDRLRKIRNGEFLANLDPKNITLIHISPISYFQYNQYSFTDRKILDLITSKLKPIDVSGWDSRSNFEGFLVYSNNDSENKIESYTQIFRNGIIEFFTHDFHAISEERDVLYLGWLELKVIEAVKNAIEVYKKMEIPPPFVVHVSITDLIDRIIDIKHRFFVRTKPFIKDEILIPNVVINDFDENIERQLKDLFDIIWQSAGWIKSPFYNDKNERKME